MKSTTMGHAMPKEHSFSILETKSGNFLNICILENFADGKNQKFFDVFVDVSEHDLIDKKQVFASRIEALMELSADDEIDESEFRECLRKLKISGTALYRHLFGSKEKNPAFKALLDRMFNRPKKYPGKIIISSDSFFFDYQFLTNGSNNEPLEDCFLGCKYIFSRKFKNHDSMLRYSDVPKLGYLAHSDFTYFHQSEKLSLERLHTAGKISLLSAFTESQSISTILQSDEYDFLHLACHIEPGLNSHSLSYLDFGARRIELEELATLNKNEGKLIFINACKSGQANPVTYLTFTKAFIRNMQVATVISADFILPETFAGDFGAKLWSKICEDGEIDWALYRNTTEFMEKRAWGGLYYAVYGETTLKND